MKYFLLLPLKLVVRLSRRIKNSWHMTMAKRIWRRAGTSPEFLDDSQLIKLDAEYPTKSSYKYDTASLQQRGQERAGKLLERFRAQKLTPKKTLEVGCFDGMVSAALTKSGVEAHAIDQTADGFDARAKEAGVMLQAADAAHIPYTDNTFDVVFSYDTFEHLQQPAQSLTEMLRVLRPGGLLYAYFGPMYMAPFGLHAYKTIGIPYVQHLFPQEITDRFLQSKNREAINYAQLNKVKRSAFEKLFRSENGFQVLEFTEEPHFAGYSILKQYSSCLKSKSSDLKDFVIANISVMLRKNS